MQSSPALLCTLCTLCTLPLRFHRAHRSLLGPPVLHPAQHDHHPTSPLPCRFSLPFSKHQPARPPNPSLRAHSSPVADAGPAPILPLLLHSCPSAPAP